MGRRKTDETVRMSSKGQLVIPAHIRRELGLKTGRVLRLMTMSNRQQLVLSLSEPESLDEMLKRSRAWKGPDLVEVLHQLRRREREEELRQHARRDH